MRLSQLFLVLSAPAPDISFGDNIAHHVKGEKCLVKGKVSDINGKVIPDAMVDVWQSGPDGLYDVQKENNVVDLRGKMKTNKNGEYFLKQLSHNFIRCNLADGASRRNIKFNG